MTRTILILMAMLSAGAPAGDDANSADLRRMQGDWMIHSMISNGLKEPDEEAQALFRTVKGEQYTVSRYTKPIGRGTFKIDASKMPKTIDSQPEGRSGPIKPILGIYEFDGDTLRICNAPPGQPRPTSLVSKLGSQYILIEWQLEKT